MEPEAILLEYRAMRWDGTMESARQICEFLDWLKPFWRITSPKTSSFALKLEIFETSPGSNSRTWQMNVNQLLVCHVDDDGRYHPEKVIDDGEQVR